MPKVPVSDNVVPFLRDTDPRPDPTVLAMVAAQMHAEGRLFEPTPMAPQNKFEAKPR